MKVKVLRLGDTVAVNSSDVSILSGLSSLLMFCKYSVPESIPKGAYVTGVVLSSWFPCGSEES